ncbi:MAG: tRNA (adenosine(37)-N6)-dimethylallyltransferase MiaA [Myxococcaceae bacterium]
MLAPLTVIAGPTASGKTALAIRVAQAIGGEIVSADSQQVYRHFDLGTAKPTAEELVSVPHHLISVVEPADLFSAMRFQTDADAAIADIHARGKRVVVVGGTGLYLRILLHGAVKAPPASPALRADLEKEAEANGRPALHAKLAAVDPETASWVKTTDLVRIIRALEIHALTGQKASAWRREHGFAPDRFAYSLWVLDPPREELYERINQRTRRLFAAGLVSEAQRLIERGFRDAPPMGSVGYVQARDLIEGRFASEEEAIDKAAQATRHYAKRQRTWFRKEAGARFVWPVDEAFRQILARIAK